MFTLSHCFGALTKVEVVPFSATTLTAAAQLPSSAAGLKLRSLTRKRRISPPYFRISSSTFKPSLTRPYYGTLRREPAIAGLE